MSYRLIRPTDVIEKQWRLQKMSRAVRSRSYRVNAKSECERTGQRERAAVEKLVHKWGDQRTPDYFLFGVNRTELAIDRTSLFTIEITVRPFNQRVIRIRESALPRDLESCNAVVLSSRRRNNLIIARH